jgi:hypothetical protein
MLLGEIGDELPVVDPGLRSVIDLVFMLVETLLRPDELPPPATAIS